MTWDSKAVGAVTIARLMALPPEKVYEELREYGAANVSDRLGMHGDEALEQALLTRADPLINLALAQFGGSTSVVRELYTRAKDGTADQVQDSAVRVACLTNQVCPNRIFGNDEVLDDAEIRQLALEGDGISLLLSNPSQRRLVDKLFNQESPFDGLPNERLRGLVAYATRNPALSLDESNRFGPDLDAYGIRKGICNLLKTVPVEPEWANVFVSLLYVLDREYMYAAGDSDSMFVLSRWRVLPPEEKKSRDDIYGFPEGYWTQSLQPRQEFLCYMAAAFGSWLERGNTINPATGEKLFESRTLGSLNDPDQLMRCAYYGHAKMTPKEMELAHARDGDAFMLAAICNDRMFNTNESRAKLEELIRGQIRFFYYRRCKRKHARHKDFDPRPVSERGKDLLEDVIEDKTSDELKGITAIESRMAVLEARLTRLQRYAGWAIVILAIIAFEVIFRR